MNIQTQSVRPDTLTKGDYVWSPQTLQWEPVTDAYWSEQAQIYVVWCGPLGMQMQTFGPGAKVSRQRYY